MGPEVGPAFQRRCRRPPLVNSWRPVGWNGVQARGFQRNAHFLASWSWDTYKHPCFWQFRNFRNLSRVGARYLGILAFAPRSGPHPARAPGAQMIQMASGSSLAFQRLSRESLRAFLSVRPASGDLNFEN
eukprot:gene14594-biopygen9649